MSMPMSGMMSAMDGSNSTSMECTMNMLGNWDVIGSCFLTSSWKIKTTAQFAGTCIGVFLMVVLTEAVRRWGREWDRYIVSQAMQRDVPRRRRGDNKSKIEGKDMATSTREQEEGKASRVPSQDEIHRLSKDQDSIIASPAPPRGAATIARMQSAFFGLPRGSPGAQALASHSGTLFRPTVVQQAVRSLVYGVQFTGAYLVMLIAMSYNGYILIAIVLGGLVGHFVSTWDTLSMQFEQDDDDTNLMGQDGSRVKTAVPSQIAYGNVSGACCD